METLPHGLLRVELANGHRLLGHVARRQAPLVERVKLGAMVIAPADVMVTKAGALTRP